MPQQPAEDSGRQNAQSSYPHGRGYGHDYMRAGEVLGGYGYSARDEYERRRGEDGTGGAPDAGNRRQRTDAEQLS